MASLVRARWSDEYAKDRPGFSRTRLFEPGGSSSGAGPTRTWPAMDASADAGADRSALPPGLGGGRLTSQERIVL